MKKLLLLASCFAGLSAPSFAQTAVTLELINPTTGLPVTTITAGSTFTLDLAIVGPATTPELDSFDLTVSGSTTSPTALPAGFTFNGFTDLTNFFGGSDAPNNPLSFGAVATSGDIPFSSTPTDLLSASFKTSSSLASGTYSIDFPPVGSFQDLSSTSGDISYNPIDATITVISASIPEPQVNGLMLAGLVALVGFGLLKRRGLRS